MLGQYWRELKNEISMDYHYWVDCRNIYHLFILASSDQNAEIKKDPRHFSSDVCHSNNGLISMVGLWINTQRFSIDFGEWD